MRLSLIAAINSLFDMWAGLAYIPPFFSLAHRKKDMGRAPRLTYRDRLRMTRGEAIAREIRKIEQDFVGHVSSFKRKFDKLGRGTAEHRASHARLREDEKARDRKVAAKRLELAEYLADTARVEADRLRAGNIERLATLDPKHAAKRMAAAHRRGKPKVTLAVRPAGVRNTAFVSTLKATLFDVKPCKRYVMPYCRKAREKTKRLVI